MPLSGQIDPGTVSLMLELREAGVSFSQIASRLNELGGAAPKGGRWYGASVHRLLGTLKAPALHRCTPGCQEQRRNCIRQQQTSNSLQ